MPPQEAYRDVENGATSAEIRRISTSHVGREGDEYSNLVQFISTYRDTRALPEEETDDATHPKKAPWYAPWRRSKDKGSHFVVPPEWLNTDIRTGLHSTDVEPRRAKVGWNEITTETENMFLKFLGYFTGPILYGISPPKLDRTDAG